ncbi:hypothetical protein V8F33_002304 [Rhypophila sp. PSN 637]
MRFISTVLSGLLFGSSVLAVEEPECNNDAILNCFNSSTSQARAYCTASLGLASTTRIVTVTPTITITETVTTTDVPTAIPTVTVTTELRRKKKRGVCTKRDVQLDCLLTSAFIATTQLASACSCLGVVATSTTTAEPTSITVSEIHYAPQSCPIVASAVFSTVTETLPASVAASTITQTLPPSVVVSTIYEQVTQTDTAVSVHVSEGTVYTTIIETVTATQTDVSLSTLVQTTLSEATVYTTVVETITATATQTAVSTQISVSVSVSSYPVTVSVPVTVTESTTVVTSVVSSVETTATGLVNGNFEGGDSDGWSVIASSGNGYTVSIVNGGVGGTKALDIYTSYFVSFVPISVTYGQVLVCVAGQKYRLLFNAAVVSSYSNGNAWSVVLGGNTITSGGGNAVSWSTYISTHTCGSTAASNRLELRASSSNNRAAHFQFDNFELYRLT